MSTSNPLPSFDPSQYLAANADIGDAYRDNKFDAQRFATPEEFADWHYKNWGVNENRALTAAGDKDPLGRWKYGDEHWTKGVDPDAAENLYREIAGITSRLGQYDPKIANQLWSSEGFGSRDKNMQAMVGDLQRYGVTSLSDLQVVPRDITKQTAFELRPDGSVYVTRKTGKEQYSTKPATPEELAAIEKTPEYAAALDQRASWKAPIGGKGSERQMPPIQFEAGLPTGKQTGSLINARTGQVIDDNKDNSPLESGFSIGQTKAGKGKTAFNLYPVQTQGPDGTTQYNFIPGTEYRATGLRKVMQDYGPLLGMASMFLGIPGVAAGMGTAGAVAKVGLGALNAANAFDQGKVLAGIGSLAGLTPAVNAVGNLGMSANTLSNIKNVGTLANVGGALQNKNYLSALAGASKLMPGEGEFDFAGVPVNRALYGLEALKDLGRGDYLGAALGGLEATGQRTVPGTRLDTRDAGSALNMYRSIKRGLPMGAMKSIIAMDRRRPQTAELAAGGVVPDLSRYMRTLPNGSRTDKLRGIAAIANGA